MNILEAYRKHWVRIGLSLLIVLLFVGYVREDVKLGFIDKLESIAYDYRLRLTMPGTVDPRIVIVDIDERSLAREGHWPWGRDKLARLTDQLFATYRIALLGFDVTFAERDESSGLGVLERLAATELSDVADLATRLEGLRPALDRDRIFAAALDGRPVVLGYFFTETGAEGSDPRVGELPPPVFRAGQFIGRNVQFLAFGGYAANIAPLQAAAVGSGHLMTEPDPDGLVRRVPILVKFEGDGNYYGSLAFAMARAARDFPEVRPGFPAEARASRYAAMDWLQLGDRRIPVDERVQALVPFRGPSRGFPYVSATDVIHGTADAAVLEDRIALVGASAKGLQDLRATPVGGAFPGVEVHASLLAGILDGTIKENPPYTLGGEFLAIVLSGLVMALLLPLLSPLWATVATGLLLAAVVVVNLAIWVHLNLVFALAPGLVMIVALFLLNMSYGYFVESRGKRQLAGLFGQYVPPELVDEMSEHPEAYSLEGESREMTVLFSDVRDFTRISERLEPRELSALMNEYLSPMTRVIQRHRGTIDKYMGDAIMCFWGAPLHDPEHARHALEASLEMIRTLHGELNPEYERRGWGEIRIGIGLNTGVMSVGNMGSEFRMAYTVMGDAVNLGARLEGLTKGYGVDVIVSETTREQVPEYAYRELDRVRVKGKETPVTIYEPLGPARGLEAGVTDELELYTHALRLYRGQDWDRAEIQFLNLLERAPERTLYQLYAERIAYFRETPPGEDWDGVFTFLTK